MLETILSRPGLPNSIYSIPIYRVRNFSNAKEAKRYILTDTIDLGVGTISSYIVITEGTKVNRLYRKKIGLKEV